MAGVEGGRQEGKGAGRVLMMTSEASPGCHFFGSRRASCSFDTPTREKQNLSPFISSPKQTLVVDCPASDQEQDSERRCGVDALWTPSDC